MKKFSSEKCSLIEEVGHNFECRHNMSPLSGRIYGCLILSGIEGFSFEEIVEITQASKSSISTNINLLLQLNYIEYFTKTGDRKRYFRPTESYLKITLQSYKIIAEKELEIVKKINEFNKENHPEKFKQNESIGLIFQEYLNIHKENLQTTIDKMNSFHARNAS